MTNENMSIWNDVCRPPKTALKEIKAGRLRGMYDINPQWRLRILTEVFGSCGDGWKYTIDRLWAEPGADGQVCAFALISLFYRINEKWSDAIPGIGGSALVAKEKAGLYTSDECYKMAVTDAISVAAKSLGVAADIYEGRWDGSKYKDDGNSAGVAVIEDWQAKNIEQLIKDVKADKKRFLSYIKKSYGVDTIAAIPAAKFDDIVRILEAKRNAK